MEKATKGVLKKSVILFFLVGSLSACYGTKVPPPQSSSQGPPGIGNPSSITAVDFDIPDNLPDLVVVYRQRLFEKSAHISPQMAQKYADAEIASLKDRYQGRDAELKAVLVKRLQYAPPRQPNQYQNQSQDKSETKSDSSQLRAYPRDPAMKDMEDEQ